MKVYKVKVNGKVYEVELESVSEKAGNIAAPAAAPQPAAPQAAPQPVASGAGNEQKAPMAGTILDVKVSVGQQVNARDVLFILEAMKLENEVVAEFSGVVKSIAVAKGASVQNGQVLVVIG
jgi:biotin carboxyl carrier protein